MTEGTICAATFSPSEYPGSLFYMLFPISKPKLYAHLSMTLICTGLHILPVASPWPVCLQIYITISHRNQAKQQQRVHGCAHASFRACETKDTDVHDSIMQHTKTSPAASDADKVSITVSLFICPVLKVL